MIIDFEYVKNDQKDFLKHLEMECGIKCPNDKFVVPMWLALALLTELMEIANEKKSFKWWDRLPADNEKVLTEVSDLLSHIGNLANALEVDLVMEINEIQVTAVETTFIRLAYRFTTLPGNKRQARNTLKNYIIPLFAELVYSLGFDMDELREAYETKMKANYTRFI